MQQGIYELLHGVAKKRSNREKIAELQRITQLKPQVITMLKYALKSNIIFVDLPQGGDLEEDMKSLGFELSPKESDLQNVLYSDIRRIKHFIAGNSPGLTRTKRQNLFVDLLRYVDRDDAKLLWAMKDKELPFGHRLTKKLVLEALPEVTEGW